MREPDVFIRADHVLLRVVRQIRDDQWAMVMPPSFATPTRPQPTLRDIINDHAYDDAWVPAMLAGRTMNEVGPDTFKGDVLGDDPQVTFAQIVDQACAAARAIQDADLDRTVHCSFGDFPMREYFWQITTYRALRAYDIAQVLGVAPTLPDDLVQGLWDQLHPVAEEWRAVGVFGPRVAVPEHASLHDALLALTGRQP